MSLQGWFLTAFIAFSVSALFAWAIYTFGGWAIRFWYCWLSPDFPYLPAAPASGERKQRKNLSSGRRKIPAVQVLKDSSSGIKQTLAGIKTSLHDSLFGILQEDELLLERAEQGNPPIGKGNKIEEKAFQRHSTYRGKQC